MALVMISYMLWEAWQIDYGPKPQVVVSEKPVIAGAQAAMHRHSNKPQHKPRWKKPVKSFASKPTCLLWKLTPKAVLYAIWI